MKLPRLSQQQLKQRVQHCIEKFNDWTFVETNLSDTSIVIVTPHMHLRKAVEKILGMKKIYVELLHFFRRTARFFHSRWSLGCLLFSL